MHMVFDGKTWKAARRARKWQTLFGYAGSIFLFVALIALFDGLLAQMRSGSNELDILPGQSLTLSGPAVLKNPLDSDLQAHFSPPSAPLTFELEGFFTGYWFGNGMWRGSVSAAPEATSGSYRLRIAFKGASARTAQEYEINVHASPAAMQAASHSLFKRHAGINPFMMAAICGAIGIATGAITYFFGRRFTSALLRMNLVEIYRVDGSGNIWCLVPRNRIPRAGTEFAVTDRNGVPHGLARSQEWRKGKLRLTPLSGNPAPEDALVCLEPVAEHKNMHSAPTQNM